MLKTFRFFKWSGRKTVAIFAILMILIVSASFSTTVAYLTKKTTAKPTTYAPAEIEISSWTYNDVINAGDSKIFVRALIVNAWVSNDESKTVYAQDPVQGVDYELTIEDGWFLASDGFYYRSQRLNAAQSVNFVTATQLKEKDGYTLRILVLYSGLQADYEPAINQAWPAVTVENGRLVKATVEGGTQQAN